MGLGMARVEDADVAARVFRALELERAVYYLQETIPHGGRDIRALVVGERVVGAIARVGDGWRTNVARGARAEPVALDAAQEELCVRACRAVGADYGGVDLLPGPDGRDYVVEVNGIPGWQGVERATGADVAGALVEWVEALVG
jgi:RimK family alpha-L-glutamate ligase